MKDSNQNQTDYSLVVDSADDPSSTKVPPARLPPREKKSTEEEARQKEKDEEYSRGTGVVDPTVDTDDATHRRASRWLADHISRSLAEDPELPRQE